MPKARKITVETIKAHFDLLSLSDKIILSEYVKDQLAKEKARLEGELKLIG